MAAGSCERSTHGRASESTDGRAPASSRVVGDQQGVAGSSGACHHLLEEEPGSYGQMTRQRLGTSQVTTCRREEGGIKGAGAFRVGRVAAHRVPAGRGVSGPRVSPALGPHTLGPLLAPPAYGVDHAYWAADGRRSHGNRAGPPGRGSVVARSARRQGATLPRKKELGPTTPGPLGRRRRLVVV